ncbi:organic cation transporter protein-like [Anneissia japonica]|uniref:organic cation transporter protein-like n=1 Tax=Anneissia japonica TaxID=1529436 RepID=UPI0014256A34|nr:organic cation transporter protein-like [Anneissia japonica]
MHLSRRSYPKRESDLVKQGILEKTYRTEYKPIQQQTPLWKKHFPKMKLDDVLAQIGEFGRYQLWVFHWYCMLTFSVAFHHLGQVFLGGASDHWCKVPDTVTANCSFLEDTGCPFNSSVTIPVDDPTTAENEHNCMQYDSYYNITNDTPLIGCTDGYQFDHSQYTNTIQEDFDLVCSRKASAALAQSVYFGGLLVGSIFFGSVADRIGRKPTIIICCLLNSSLGVVAAFVQSFAAYVCLRFIIAMATMGIYLIVFVFSTELVGLKMRCVAGNVVPMYWACGIMLLALLGYFIRDWRTLQIVLSVPTAVAAIYVAFLPESARWLLSQGEFSKAEAIIQRAAKVNKVTIPQNIFDDKEEHSIPFLTDPGVFRVAVAMAGKFAITAAFSIVYIYSAELFPTPVRSAGMGLASMSGRLGSILSPLALLMTEIWKPLPLVIFSSLSVVAGLLGLLLPETLGTNLPETIEEGENFGKKYIALQKNDENAQELQNTCVANKEGNGTV